jgi:magnesium-transporting ATPase (P-type)
MIDIELNLPYQQSPLLLRFQILHIFEFTSKRKRMSVVVKCVNPTEDVKFLDGIKVLTKGADGVLE